MAEEKNNTTAILERILQSLGGLLLTACFVLWVGQSDRINTIELKLKSVEVRLDESNKDTERIRADIKEALSTLTHQMDKINDKIDRLTARP